MKGRDARLRILVPQCGIGPTRFMVMATKAGRALVNMNYFAAV